MQKNLFILMSAASVVLLSSCSGKLGALSADNFTVTPNPLETQVGKVPATVNGTFPEKYMKKKAVVKVVPELRYADGQVVKGQGATFQGEKVQGNDQTISYKVGGNYTMQSNFSYVPAMQQSDLWLTFDARVGKKSVSVPAVKVGTGVIATSELYKQLLTSTGACIAPDSFKQIVAHRQEAQVKFLVNQANLRQSELKNNSVQEFVNLLKKINRESEKLALQNVEVLGYASPEGSFDFNDRLANRRGDVAADYVDKQLRQNKLTSEIDQRYTAEDWDGFQQLVQASNIQDKDVILRVLSMYKDPEERERQIRNMSAGYRELADGILPELRRSRLIINYNVIGRTNEQIQQQYAADPSVLSNEELLYAATLTDNAAQKEQIYKTAAAQFPADYRALNNIAALAFNRGDNATAQDYLARALRVTSNAPEANANLGLLALQQGDVAKAENLIAKAVGANGLNDVLGSLNIAKGNYAQAAANLKNSFNNTAALAEILNKNYASAEVILNGIKNKDAFTSYLQAITAARQGNNGPAAQFLQQALTKDPGLAAYAAKDLELRNVSK